MPLISQSIFVMALILIQTPAFGSTVLLDLWCKGETREKKTYDVKIKKAAHESGTTWRILELDYNGERLHYGEDIVRSVGIDTSRDGIALEYLTYSGGKSRTDEQGEYLPSERIYISLNLKKTPKTKKVDPKGEEQDVLTLIYPFENYLRVTTETLLIRLFIGKNEERDDESKYIELDLEEVSCKLFQ